MWGNIVKTLKVMDLLARQNGATKKDIARITGKSDRQVYRILQAIEHIGIPIYNDRIDGGREKTWRIEESYLTKLKNLNVPDLSFTLPELFVLSFLKGSSSVFYESEIFKYVDSSFSKLKGLAPERLFEVFERMEKVFLNRCRFAKNYSGHEDIMLDILEAIIGRRNALSGTTPSSQISSRITTPNRFISFRRTADFTFFFTLIRAESPELLPLRELKMSRLQTKILNIRQALMRLNS